ncbi:MAG: ribbon-helix-helix domain-containing protein [Candidatus Woesearchaeota archaeon]|nr:ribbon-helix-helix domain-containing protein [Candidatus Woesearchaeota archaeon]
METVSLRFEESFIHDIEKVMKENRYATKTEFIREAVRDKIKDIEKRAALLRLERAYGAGKHKGRKITDADIHRAGEETFKELAKNLGLSSN